MAVPEMPQSPVVCRRCNPVHTPRPGLAWVGDVSRFYHLAGLCWTNAQRKHLETVVAAAMLPQGWAPTVTPPAHTSCSCRYCTPDNPADVQAIDSTFAYLIHAQWVPADLTSLSNMAKNEMGPPTKDGGA
jgi:hypothetical protein